MKKSCSGILLLVMILVLITSCGDNHTASKNENVDASQYIGEYLDEGIGDLGLIISQNNDTFHIELSIYRLAGFDDGVGKLTADGILFTATDPAGNPISALITVNEDVAEVVFTDSTWEYIKNGDIFQYIRTSGAVNI